MQRVKSVALACLLRSLIMHVRGYANFFPYEEAKLKYKPDKLIKDKSFTLKKTLLFQKVETLSYAAVCTKDSS